VRWKLTERGSAAGTLVLVKTLRDTGLPWGVAVSLDPTMELRTPLLLGGLALLGLAILGALYLAYRAVRRELQVAEMQTEFVAAVSHEFRTPITALTHLTELLETGETAEERRPLYYQALARETRRLKEMVENLLDFGRMEAGRYRYKPEEVDTAELVRALVEEFKMEPAAAGREVALEAGDAKVTVDRGAMRRAVWNLLDNAAKYSPAGAPIMVRTAAADGWAELSVKDEGPGIARDEQQRIFQKFVRGRTAGSQDVKGTGIGLAMVQAIARAHGGKVDLKSEPGQGSRFTIRLPMKEK
jgi:two-component system phosphate regulon sensor histidine kinase PhoR